MSPLMTVTEPLAGPAEGLATVPRLVVEHHDHIETSTWSMMVKPMAHAAGDRCGDPRRSAGLDAVHGDLPDVDEATTSSTLSRRPPAAPAPAARPDRRWTGPGAR